MTGLEIVTFVDGRGKDFSRTDLTRLNDMLIELPVEQISDTRAWVMEGIALTVNDPLYAGDLDPID